MSSISLLLIGNEILSGRTQDKNGKFIASQLARAGIGLQEIVVVPDDLKHIVQALGTLSETSDNIVVSGGLGPTTDDITVSALCQFANDMPVVDKKYYSEIKRNLSKRKSFVAKLAEKQATVPERSKLLPNEVGIAKGIIVEQGITTVYALPGVPLELEVMFANGVLPLLLKGQRGRSCSSEVIKTAGISESVLMQKIGKISKIYPDIELGFYPNYGEVTLILKTILAKKAKLRLLKNKIQNKLKPWVYADQEISLTEAVALKLKKKKYKISTAESCTGGLIAKRLTDTSGASAYFKGGIIAYNNAIKIQHLGVEASALKKYGAVSSVVARQMAKGAMRQFKTQVAISITGIAGPSGGTKSKPVGTVFMCISIKNKLAMYSLKIKGSRTVIRYRASQIAMIQLLKLLSRS